MLASEMNRIALKAKREGYDRVVKHYYRKIVEAAKIGETGMVEAIMPWFKVETKHIDFFITRGFKVDVRAKEIEIDWSEIGDNDG